MNNGPLMIEFLGTQGAGKTTLTPTVVDYLKERGIQARTPIQAARCFAQRTVIGKIVRLLTPVFLREKLLWQVYYYLSLLYRIRFRSANRDLLELVEISQKNRPRDAAVLERRILYWFSYLAGTYEFLTRHALPTEALIYDDGFVHRVVHLNASVVEVPDPGEIRRYLDLIPKPDIVIVPQVPVDVCVDRVSKRGVWNYFQGKSFHELEQYLMNSTLIVDETVSYLRDKQWVLIEVDNSGEDLQTSVAELRQKLSGYI